MPYNIRQQFFDEVYAVYHNECTAMESVREMELCFPEYSREFIVAYLNEICRSNDVIEMFR